MNNDFRKTKQYKNSMCRIKNYKRGFIFSFNYKEISNAKRNVLNILTEDCVKNGILEILNVTSGISGNPITISYRKI